MPEQVPIDVSTCNALSSSFQQETTVISKTCQNSLSILICGLFKYVIGYPNYMTAKRYNWRLINWKGTGTNRTCKDAVFCAVGTEFLSLIQTNFTLRIITGPIFKRPQRKFATWICPQAVNRKLLNSKIIIYN
jgi:hypothetical protein